MIVLTEDEFQLLSVITDAFDKSELVFNFKHSFNLTFCFNQSQAQDILLVLDVYQLESDITGRWKRCAVPGCNTGEEIL